MSSETQQSPNQCVNMFTVEAVHCSVAKRESNSGKVLLVVYSNLRLQSNSRCLLLLAFVFSLSYGVISLAIRRVYSDDLRVPRVQSSLSHDFSGWSVRCPIRCCGK